MSFSNYDACYCTLFKDRKRIWRCKYGFETFEEADEFLEDKVHPYLIVKNCKFSPMPVRNFWIQRQISENFNNRDEIYTHPEGAEGTFFK